MAEKKPEPIDLTDDENDDWLQKVRDRRAKKRGHKELTDRPPPDAPEAQVPKAPEEE